MRLKQYEIKNTEEQTVWKGAANKVRSLREASRCVLQQQYVNLSHQTSQSSSPRVEKRENYKCNNSFSCLLPPTRHRWCLWRHLATEILLWQSENLQNFRKKSNQVQLLQRRRERPPSGSLSLPTLNQMWNSGLCQTLIPSPRTSEKMIAPKYENICVSGKSEEDEMVGVQWVKRQILSNGVVRGGPNYPEER